MNRRKEIKGQSLGRHMNIRENTFSGKWEFGNQSFWRSQEVRVDRNIDVHWKQDTSR